VRSLGIHYIPRLRTPIPFRKVVRRL